MGTRKKMTTEEFVIKIKLKYGDLYDYSLINYTAYRVSVKLICNKHGEFEETPDRLLNKSSAACKKCSFEALSKKFAFTTEEFIEKSNIIHNNYYDYSKSVYKNANTKVTIICPKHGDFEQSGGMHMKGQGCRKCATIINTNKKRLNTKLFIERCKEIHGEKFTYENTIYISVDEKVIITCKIHGDFEISPQNIFKAIEGCKQCVSLARTKQNTNKRDLEKDKRNFNFIEKAKCLHKDKYLYNNTNYISCTDDVLVDCKKHGSFLINASHHLQGWGCSKCSREENFLKIAKEKHNDNFDYSNIFYIDLDSAINIVCKKHGNISILAKRHINSESGGCDKCLNNLLTESAKNKKINSELFFKECNNVHNYKYDYSESIYISSTDKITIICPKHGKFEQQASLHKNGTGCSKCGVEIVSNLKRYTQKEYIDLVTEIHNGKYDYSKSIYSCSTDKIEIICPTHGSFWQRAAAHIRGSSCPNCAKIISNKETKWLDYLNIPNEYRNPTIKVENKIFKPDALDPITNTIYEFDGSYWHGDPAIYSSDKINLINKKTFGELYKNTMEKKNILIKNGYNIISIWESEWDLLCKKIKKDNKGKK